MRLALLAACLLPAFAAAQPGYTVPNPIPERYHMILFGGQGDLFRPPRTAHTWATFVRTSGDTVTGVDTISWLPATLHVRPLALKPETGANLTLGEMLAFLEKNPRNRVVAWGSYEITADRYAQALAQKAVLESGAVRYHSLGLFGRRDDVMHCTDGVTRLAPEWEAKANPSRWYGEAGTGQAVRAAVRSGVVLNPSVTADCLYPQVNPDGYKLTVRTLGFRPLLR